MRRLVILLLLFGTALSGSASFRTTVERIYSTQVGDSFDIYVSIPDSYSALRKYDWVFYCDAGLKLGQELRQQLASPQADSMEAIFIGIAQIGNFHVLRRRDFILPAIKGADTAAASKVYGHIVEFYQFLKTELVPLMETRYPGSGRRAILGHSLSGLFAVYCLFRNETLFDRFIALSPSLWIDHEAIYRFCRTGPSRELKGQLYLSAGSRENFNQILRGNEKMKKFLQNGNHSHVDLIYRIHPGTTHNSQVPVSLAEVLKLLNDHGPVPAQ